MNGVYPDFSLTTAGYFEDVFDLKRAQRQLGHLEKMELQVIIPRFTLLTIVNNNI
jgi:hypothetical protein